MEIYYINLDESIERREAMEKAFPHDRLTRVPAVDGAVWASKDVDRCGRLLWNPAKLTALKEIGAIHREFERYSPLYPRAFGCNLSHVVVWKMLLETKAGSCIVLEDDTQPTPRMSGVSVARSVGGLTEGVDFLYLFDEWCPGHRIRLHPDKSIRFARSLMGYWINRKAARVMLKAAAPAVHQTDWQIPFRLFEPLRKNLPPAILPRDLELLPAIVARGIRRGVIEHSPLAKWSTFTVDGRKPWLNAPGELP